MKGVRQIMPYSAINTTPDTKSRLESPYVKALPALLPS